MNSTLPKHKTGAGEIEMRDEEADQQPPSPIEVVQENTNEGLVEQEKLPSPEPIHNQTPKPQSFDTRKNNSTMLQSKMEHIAKQDVRSSMQGFNNTENDGTTVDDQVRTSMVLRESNQFQPGLKNETQINASQTGSMERNGEEEKQP